MEIELKVLEKITQYCNVVKNCIIFNNLDIDNKINNNIEFINSNINENIKIKLNSQKKYDLILDNCKFYNYLNILSLYDNLINLLNINGILCLIINKNLCINNLSINFYKCIFQLKYGMELIFIYNIDFTDEDWYDLINNPELENPKKYIVIMAIKKSDNRLNLVDNEPDYNDLPKKNKIMFVTAFKDINRNLLANEFKITNDEYISRFSNLIKNNLSLCCFCENEIKTKLNNDLNFYNIYDYNYKNTFYKLLDSQTTIMKSELYTNFINHRKDHPENSLPEYNIVNHNKIIFIERIKKLYPNYNHYAWIDFGWIKDSSNIYKDFNWDSLPDKIQYASSTNVKPEIIPDILTNLIHAPEIIYGGLFFIPYNLVDWYVNKYTDMVNFFECCNIVDDDQAIVCQIYKKYSEFFSLYNSNNNWYKLLSVYGINFNSNLNLPNFSNNIINNLKNINSSKIKIGFHSKQLCIRGTTVALFDYAYYNKKLYNNESIIFYRKNNELNDSEVIKKFEKEFKLYAYNDFDEVDNILLNENIKYLYSCYHGYSKDSLLSNVSKNLIHAVFNIEPHGDRYAVISEPMADDYNKSNENKVDFVSHMINLPDIKENMRSSLLIPEDAIVLGRYGGYEQFNIGEVFESIKEILEIDDNIYFIFANTKIFYIHPRIIYLNKIVDLESKVKFINTCDGMIHARIDGETFGLSIGEFSSLNKPVITCKTPGFNYHINILKEKGLYYYDKDSLINIFKNMKLIKELKYDWNAYKEFTPENIMKKFIKFFIE